MATNWKFNKDGTIEDKDGNKVEFSKLVVNTDGKVTDVKGDDVDVVVADAQKLGGKEATEYTDRNEVEIKTGIMNRASFKRMQEIIKSKYNSGFKSTPYINSQYEDGSYHFGAIHPHFTSREPQHLNRGDKYINHIGIGNREHNSGDYEVILNGVIFYIPGRYQNIPMLSEPTINMVVKDSKKTSTAVSAKDFILLKDLDRELITNGTFDDNLDGWESDTSKATTDTSKIEKTDEGYMKITSGDKQSQYGHATIECNLKAGIRYRFKIDIISVNDDKYDLIRCGYTNDKTKASCDRIMQGFNKGTNIFDFIPDQDTKYIMIGGRDDINELIVDNVSIKQVEEQVLVCLDNIDKEVDLYQNLSKVRAVDSVSRSDLLIMESWLEDVTEKDVYYEQGLPQLSGGHRVDWFDGCDTYTLWHEEQQPGDAQHNGYQWSKLSDASKKHVMNNPKNNLFMDTDGKVYQYRLRFRIIKGMHHDFTLKSGETWMTKYSYGSGVTRYIGIQANLTKPYISNILSRTLHSVYRTSEGLTGENLFYSYTKNDMPNEFNSDLNPYVYGLPLAVIEKRNNGIFHKVFNPEGSAGLINDNKDGVEYKYKYILDDNYKIKSIEDCFDIDLIAYTDKDGNVVSSDDDNAKYRTGSVSSKLARNDNNMYYDQVYIHDLKDLRSIAELPNEKTLTESYFNKVYTSTFNNGSEELPWFGNYNRIRKYSGRINNSGGSHTKTIKPSYKQLIYSNTDGYKSFIPSSVIVFRSNKINKFASCLQNRSSNEQKHHIHLDYGGKFYSYNAKWNKEVGNLENDTTEDDEIDVFVSKGRSIVNNVDYIHTEIIGDYRKLKYRRNKEVISDDEVITIEKNMYLLCSDNTNNGGKEGHMYRYINDSTLSDIHTNSDDGDANASSGHIDFSDDDKWLDLGDNLEVGGYNDLWFDKGINGIPLVYGDDDETLFPIYVDSTSSACYGDNPYKRFQAKKKIIGFRHYYIRKKDGSWEFFSNASSGGSCPNWDHDGAAVVPTQGNASENNCHHIVFNDGFAEHLGYSNKEEMEDLVVIVAVYPTKANLSKYSGVNAILNLGQFVCMDTGSDFDAGAAFIPDMINKTGGQRYQDTSCVRLAIEHGTFNNGNINPHTDNSLNYNVNKLPNKGSKNVGIKYIYCLILKYNQYHLAILGDEIHFETDSWKDDGILRFRKNAISTKNIDGKQLVKFSKLIPLPYYYRKQLKDK